MSIFDLFKKKPPINYLEFFLAIKTNPIFLRAMLLYKDTAAISDFNLN